jgi:hypothetical protein
VARELQRRPGLLQSDEALTAVLEAAAEKLQAAGPSGQSPEAQAGWRGARQAAQEVGEVANLLGSPEARRRLLDSSPQNSEGARRAAAAQLLGGVKKTATAAVPAWQAAASDLEAAALAAGGPELVAHLKAGITSALNERRDIQDDPAMLERFLAGCLAGLKAPKPKVPGPLAAAASPDVLRTALGPEALGRLVAATAWATMPKPEQPAAKGRAAAGRVERETVFFRT